MGVTKRVSPSKKGKRTKYQAAVYNQGKLVATKSFDTKSSAWIWHDKLLREYNDPFHRPKLSNEISLAQVYEKYCEIRLPQLRESTRQTQKNRHKYIKESPLFNKVMSEVDAKAIDSWFEWIKKQPTAEKKGRKSFRQEFNFLRSIIHWYREYMDDQYIVPILKRHSKAVNYKVIQQRRPDYYMRPKEISDWLTWLRNEKSSPVYSQLAAFLVLTGCRLGEACGLHWEFVDLDNSIASIVQTVWWDHSSKEPKLQDAAKNDGSVRIVRLSKSLVEFLRTMNKEHNGTGPVFRRDENQLLISTTIRKAFNDGFKALGLPWRSTHICRHSFATLGLMESGSEAIVQAALGHKDSRQTQKYAKIVALLDGKINDQVANVIELDVSRFGS